MKKIAIVTATRAEYGLLSPVIKELRKREDDELKVDLIVTGMHLSEEYGLTVNEINDRIDYKIPIPVKSSNAFDISTNQAETLVAFSDLFMREKYDCILLLGDRYEALSIAVAAGNTRTPVFHLCGGDVTEGAIDEWIRHSITKISYLHFVTNDISRNRVIQLGESPDRVFNFGSTSIDNILNIDYCSKEEALEDLGLMDCNYVLCTYHPVTMEGNQVDGKIESILNAMKKCSDLVFIVTKSNSDQGGSRINYLLDEANNTITNMHVFPSLGSKHYLLLMKYAELVLGNSSSGIIEAPSMGIPTVNIGDRQRGRLQCDSIINCGESTEEILIAINRARSLQYKELCHRVKSPYGDGHAAERIANKTIEVVKRGEIDLKKEFYDINKKL